MLTIDGKIKTIELLNNSLILREDSKVTVLLKQNIHVIDKDYLTSKQYTMLVPETLIQELMSNYTKCEIERSEVFRYKLNITKDKTLAGKFQFYVQVSYAH